MEPKSRAFDVLIIDDVKTLLSILETALTRLGYRVVTALSGKDGLDLFETSEVKVIVCDLAMEGLTGVEVSKEIQRVCSETGRPKPPFILLTGWGGVVEDLAKLKSSGIDMALFKPVEVDDLVNALNKVSADWG